MKNKSLILQNILVSLSVSLYIAHPHVSCGHFVLTGGDISLLPTINFDLESR